MAKTQATNSVLIEDRPSPNFNQRRAPVDILLLHYTGMADGEAAIERLCDPASEVSSHYVVNERGQILRLVSEDARAWHAGKGQWQGRGDINSRSIGIEICNGGHEFGLPAFPAKQIAAVIALCEGILERWAIAPHNVLAHSDTAPGRKSDPGERFPWARLAAAGIGHWVRPSRSRTGLTLVPGARGPDVGELQTRLADYGYELAVTGVYDEATETVVTAFQRHFLPKNCSGRGDPATRRTLERLLAARS